jgi:hypothetical protein
VTLLATVLYEDQRGPTRGFGLHEFVMRCAYDAGDIPDNRIYLLQDTVQCIPLKGSGKVRQALGHHLANLAASGQPVFVVLDNDRVRDLLNLPPQANAEEVVDAINSLCRGSGIRVNVTLLVQNTESVLDAAVQCDPDIDQNLAGKAIERKEPGARDILFGRLARAAQRAIRDCILQHIPSLRPLTEDLARIFAHVRT